MKLDTLNWTWIIAVFKSSNKNMETIWNYVNFPKQVIGMGDANLSWICMDVTVKSWNIGILILGDKYILIN